MGQMGQKLDLLPARGHMGWCLKAFVKIWLMGNTPATNLKMILLTTSNG
jgi:hypothetical protein